MEEQVYSYVHGVGVRPLSGLTLGERLRELAGRQPDGMALIDCAQGLRMTWRELDAAADDFACTLLRLGLEPGARVAIWAMNRHEWVVAQFATARVGMILVALNPALRETELGQYLNLTGSSALITQEAFKSSDFAAMLAALLPELADCADGPLRSEVVPSLRHVIRFGSGRAAGMLDYDDLARPPDATARSRLAEIAARVRCDDPVTIQFSNATGGLPAAATLTHHNILNNGMVVAQTLRLKAQDRVCIPVPLFHCFGMVIGNLACLAGGATMVLPGPAFDPRATLAALSEEGCTALLGVPAMFKAVLDEERFAEHDLTAMRTGVMSGAPCPPETMEQVITRLHMPEVTIAYGMTESSPVSFMSEIDTPVATRLTTVGSIRAFTEAKVIDADGATLPCGTAGELCVRGYNVMRGYWGDPQLTARVIDAAGWLHTGDLATLDEHGLCRIVGGVKEIVIRGGENISPVEIETFLKGLAEVRDAVAFGVPDERLGEELCVCVEPAPGVALDAGRVRALCEGRIARFKIPRYVQVYESFPASTGRALKQMLRERTLARLRAEGALDTEAET